MQWKSCAANDGRRAFGALSVDTPNGIFSFTLTGVARLFLAFKFQTRVSTHEDFTDTDTIPTALNGGWGVNPTYCANTVRPTAGGGTTCAVGGSATGEVAAVGMIHAGAMKNDWKGDAGLERLVACARILG